MRTGHCLCGDVRFQAHNVPTGASVCHCRMCQRWTGSAFVEVSVAEGDVTWTGAEHIRVYTSSGLGERAFCGRCGSHLYFRVTQEGDYYGNLDLPLGLFDDTAGFDLKAEIFVDQKPPAYGLADMGHRQITRAECLAAYPALGDVE